VDTVVAAPPAPAPIIETPAEQPQAAAPEEHWFGFCDLSAVPQRLPANEAARLKKRMHLLHETWPQLSERPVDRVVAELEQARGKAEDPDLPLLQMARLLSTTTELARAKSLFADYLTRNPHDRSTAQAAARIDTQLEIQSGYGQRSSRGITVWFDRSVVTDARADELAAEIRAAIDEAATLTRTPARNELTVVVYPSRSELLASTCVPDWSGGVFDGTLRLVAKDAPSMTRAVRHEGLHAQVEPLMVSNPSWFSEGVAEYFERPEVKVDASVARGLIKHSGIVPFAKLGNAIAGTDGKLASMAYLQSDGMVRWLLARRGLLAIADATSYFQKGGSPTGVFTFLEPAGTLNEDAFSAWIQEQAR
jgi:hypothetical protein